MSTTTLTAIYDLLTGIGPSGERRSEWLLAHIAALEQERDAAVADNAALLFLVRVAGGERGPTARCWACGGGSAHSPTCRFGAVLDRAHPGAAMLEEHRKALVRARNEGLERAAMAVKEIDGMVTQRTKIVLAIRATKEPEK